MPLVRISLNRKTPHFARSVADAIHQSMVDTISIPADDRFQIITQHDTEDLVYDPNFYGIKRTDGFISVQITLAPGRSLEVKRNLYRRMTELLAERADVRAQDVFITLHEIPPENFSLGNGEAQFADALPPHLQMLKVG